MFKVKATKSQLSNPPFGKEVATVIINDDPTVCQLVFHFIQDFVLVQNGTFEFFIVAVEEVVRLGQVTDIQMLRGRQSGRRVEWEEGGGQEGKRKKGVGNKEYI